MSERLHNGYKITSTTLHTLVLVNSGRNASDPRDMIYALLGLSSCPKSFDVDYSKSVRQVYVEATKVMIMGISNDKKTPKSSLNIICSAYRCYKKSAFGLPSWVPDFSLKQDFRGLFQKVLMKRKPKGVVVGYNAMGEGGV